MDISYVPGEIILEDNPEDLDTKRDVNDVLSHIKTHLTKEELLCFSIYKNSKKQKNQIHRVFLEKYHGKKLSSSAVTKRKKRLMDVLGHVRALLQFKQSTNVDHKLKDLLTTKQYIVLMLYERRVSMKEIGEQLGLAEWKPGCPASRSISMRFYGAVDRLNESKNKDLHRYLELLGNVLKFSRKYPASKR